MYPSWMEEASFYEILTGMDAELAEEVRTAGCRLCGGVVHRASYPRKPRGGPRDLGVEYERRLSFCCAQRECRRRATPPSLRFLGRRVYLGAVVVLVTALHHGVTGRRAARLRELVGVSLRTLKRWRRWWREEFMRSGLWAAARGRFRSPVAAAYLPASLLERFTGSSERERLVAVLAFVSPMTTTTSGAGSTMAI